MKLPPRCRCLLQEQYRSTDRFIAAVAFGTLQLDQQSGKIAHQTAQQLTRDGERVSFFVLIDTSSRDLAVEGRPLVSEAFHLRRKIRESSGLQDL
jgi:hypothetical protein